MQRVSRKVNLEIGNIANNLNNCEEFVVTMQGLRYNFTTLMKRNRSKTRQKVKGTGLEREELSENEQVLEDLIERFEESERRTVADTQKDSLISKTKKRKLKK